MGDMCEFMHEL